MKLKHIIVSHFFVLISCLQIGSAYPEEEAILFLTEKEYSKTVIQEVVKLLPLSDELINELIYCENFNVRYLLAMNPNLNENKLNILLNDENSFVRSGIALNKNLTYEQIEKLFTDSSYLVLSVLSKNPIVPQNVLLKLYHEKKVDLVYFASNPNCPQEIIIEIENSNNDLAKQWLEITRNRIKSKLNEKNFQLDLSK